mgnify:FL=1
MEKRWAILFILFFTRISLGFQFQTMGSVSSEVIDELQFNYAEIGSLIGLFMIPGLFLAVPAGFAGNYVSDRFIIGLGLITLSLGGVMAGFSETFELFFIGRFVCGIGFVISTIFFAKVTTDWFEGKELVTAMSILVMSWPFGIAMGQIGHGWLAITIDWRLAFFVASVYCAMSALLIVLFYQPPSKMKSTITEFYFRLTRNEILLTVVASSAWGFFNAGYVVYLSFAPQILVANGTGIISALSIISTASWVMIFSGAVCGYITDRTGKPNTILYFCIGFAMLSLLLLCFTKSSMISVLLFGLIGMAPAGLIMALAAKSMRPESRAIGMGIFFMGQFILQGPAPGIAGWIYDISQNHIYPIVFATSLFLATGVANCIFDKLKKTSPF